MIWADSLKGWLMILVILGHAIQSVMTENFYNNHIWNLIYSFHMPAFMAVSGWFAYKPYKASFKNKNYLSLIKKRYYQLFVPYIVWSIFSFVKSGNYNFDYLSKIVLFPDNFFWFLWVLFWINVIFVSTQILAAKLHLKEIVPIFIVCIILMGAMIVFELRMFGFQFLAYYFLFYTLGYCIHCFKLRITNIWICILLAVIWALLAWSWNMHSLPSWFPNITIIPTSLLQYMYRGLTAAIAIIVLLNISPIIMNGYGWLNRMVSKIGNLSLGMYVVHLALMRWGYKAIFLLMPQASDWTIVLLYLGPCVVLSYITTWLFSLNKYTSKYLLGKIY